MQRIIATLLMLVVAANGQQQTLTFQSSSQLVIETVVVKDKKGNAIEGLTEKDFTITEDGAPQTVRFFAFQKLQDTPGAAPVAAAKPVALNVRKLTHTQI